MSRNFVCGDTHIPSDIGKLNSVNWKEGSTLTKEDVLFQLGDFGGIWYPIGSNKEQEYWLDWLCNKPWTTVVVLGNHENYDIIETLPWEEKWGNEVQYYEIPNGNKIYFLKRGAIYYVNGQKILAIGGALSIDKELRVQGESWWSQEDITPQEQTSCLNELDEKGYVVDYVLTHTCPSRLVLEFIHSVDKLHDKTAVFLDYVDDRVQFKEWYFGHMHVDWTYKEGDENNQDLYTCCYNGIHELKKENDDK